MVVKCYHKTATQNLFEHALKLQWKNHAQSKTLGCLWNKVSKMWKKWKCEKEMPLTPWKVKLKNENRKWKWTS